MAYMAFICVGMVIGRLDLSSRLVAVRLTVAVPSSPPARGSYRPSSCSSSEASSTYEPRPQ